MTTIKFDRAVKYGGVRYAAHEAFKVDDADVEQLRQAGAIILSTEPVTPPQQEEDEVQDEEVVEDVSQLKEDLLKYTVSQLVEFAAARNIDLGDKTRKADIYNIIVASLN